jgi:electron transfer flavoprotein-quinone oxidoreductase
MIPSLSGDGILVTGDAAGFCYATGLNLEGINLAADSGVLAAQTVLEAREAQDYSARALKGYEQRLKGSFVLKDLKTFRHAPKMLHIDRLYDEYPEILCDVMESVYRIDGTPKQSVSKLFLRMAKDKVGTGTLARDAWTAWRAV